MKLVTFEKDGRSAVGLLNAAGTAVHPATRSPSGARFAPQYCTPRF